jgi:predicted nucleotidyltransferase
MALIETFIIEAVMNATQALFPAELSDYCRQHHIRRLSLFGSHAKGTARADSDIDLLVEFDGGMAPGLIGLAAMESELSALMGGRKVDLRTPQELSHYFRDQVVAGALVQYAA